MEGILNVVDAQRGSTFKTLFGEKLGKRAGKGTRAMGLMDGRSDIG